MTAKGDVSNLSVTDILQIDQGRKDQTVGAYKHGELYCWVVASIADFNRRLLLRREGDILIAVLKDNTARRLSNIPSSR